MVSFTWRESKLMTAGKKIVFYKSKVKRMQFGIEGENLSIQFENNALLKTVGRVV